MRVFNPIFTSVGKKAARPSSLYPIAEAKTIKAKNNMVMSSLLALAAICSPIECRTLYNGGKEIAKEGLELVGIDSGKTIYKDCARALHVTESTCNGIAHTVEFALDNPKSTYNVLSDVTSMALGKEHVDSKRLFDYLYDCSKKSGSDLKELLNELPPGSLSDVLKYVNSTISKKKNIPCSQICMDIALSNPENVKTAEYWTSNGKKLEGLISEIKDDVPGYQLEHYMEKLPVVEFKENGMHARMLQENETMQNTLREWANQPPVKRVKEMCVSLNADSDPKNGYDAYATFHNVSVMNPKKDDKGNITAYVFDVYDFERSAFNGQMLDFATIMAYHLQEAGHLKNYKILVPITIPANPPIK
ncbi:MAG: hypothetical protein NC200_08160 [Candidatus Gastranaerophilales bacterium]|nr:hypothetical protein [Candidatus Gastranaerophilales bacterium]